MTNSLRNIILLIAFILTIIVGGFIIKDWYDKKKKQERDATIEDYIKKEVYYKLQDSVLRIEIDSLKIQTVKLQETIENQSKSQKIIIQKNEEAHIDINKLDYLNAIKLFSDNISDYKNNPDRYNLKRFNK